jgi:hypothetical protein
MHWFQSLSLGDADGIILVKSLQNSGLMLQNLPYKSCANVIGDQYATSLTIEL